MRPDQLTRLGDLSEKLADVVLEEADPATWPGYGVPLADVTKDERGDRYWCKKNAAASLSLLMRVEQLRAERAPPRKPGDDEPDVDKEIARAERAAAELLDKVGQATRKQAFDAHVHGKK